MQEYLQLDGALVAGDTLYVGEHKRVLREQNVGELLLKLSKIRRASCSGRQRARVPAAGSGRRLRSRACSSRAAAAALLLLPTSAAHERCCCCPEHRPRCAGLRSRRASRPPWRRRCKA